jgi:hypothetical protein
MGKPTVFVCRVQSPEGVNDYVTLLPPELAFSRGLAPEAIVGVLSHPLAEGEPITPAVFARNRIFVEFLHAVIARRGPSLPDLIAEAERQRNGRVYLIDGRTPTPEGAVPPEDIIGAFEVRDGRIVPGSYNACPNHGVLSSNGFFQLPSELHALLVEELSNLTRSG